MPDNYIGRAFNIKMMNFYICNYALLTAQKYQKAKKGVPLFNPLDCGFRQHASSLRKLRELAYNLQAGRTLVSIPPSQEIYLWAGVSIRAILPKRRLWQMKRGVIGSVSQSNATEGAQCVNETSGYGSPLWSFEGFGGASTDTLPVAE